MAAPKAPAPVSGCDDVLASSDGDQIALVQTMLRSERAGRGRRRRPVTGGPLAPPTRISVYDEVFAQRVQTVFRSERYHEQ